MNRNRWRMMGLVALVPALALAWWLGSPLFLNRTVNEAFPAASSAPVAAAASETDRRVEPTATPSEADAEATATTAATATMEPQATPTEAMSEPEATATTAATATARPRATETAMPEPTATEAAPTATPVPPEPVALRAGSFRDGDAFHQGSGQATVYGLPDGSTVLRLEPFSVTNGPALVVLLVPHPDPTQEAQLEGWLDLGALKGNEGNQNYEIPAGADLSAYGSVVIWCRAFNVIVSVAPLQPAG